MRSHRIIPLGPSDLEPVLDHHERIANLCGVRFDRSREGRRRWADLASRPQEPGWRRMWGAVVGNAVVGHARVVCGGDSREGHRARLEAAVEPSYRCRGLGTSLVTAAVAWCEAHPFLEWIDVHLTDRESAAVALARRTGFIVAAAVEDRYRDADGPVATLWLVRRVDRWKAGAAVRSTGAGDMTLRFARRSEIESRR